MNFFKRKKQQPIENTLNYKPYRGKMDVKGIDADFFYGTSQAQTWYDPLKPYAKLEYEWVLDNIDLKGKKILDGGAHHGQYSVVFAKGGDANSELKVVDPVPMNCLMTEINMRINDLNFEIVQGAISTQKGEATFTTESNGRLSDKGNLTVKTFTLSELMPDVEVIKLDVEGHEFSIIPHEIDKLTKVTDWIVEVHPFGTNNPEELITLFKEKGFEVLWVNRDKNIVEKYVPGTEWKIHSTIFATRK